VRQLVEVKASEGFLFSYRLIAFRLSGARREEPIVSQDKTGQYDHPASVLTPRRVAIYELLSVLPAPTA
jgi:hypothetical protein